MIWKRCIKPDSSPCTIPVGASLLAIAICHSALMSTDTTPSRASSLPQVLCLAGVRCQGTAGNRNRAITGR
ncbi:hypothetical protein PSJE_29160 [Pseudomonas jessenii]|nr:hypothetical protein PSJE_29160 [Pseudomonas jessenii]